MSISITTAYSTTIDLPYGELKRVMEWCKSNCVADWKFSPGGDARHIAETHNRNEEYKFYFESERDYVAFLVWKK